MTPPPPVGRTAMLLGFAGLLPQVAGVALIVAGGRDPTDVAWIPLMIGYATVLAYGAIILSFLGGIWWGFAMRREAGQARLAVLSVMPSLMAVGCLGWAGSAFGAGGAWSAAVLGIAILLTLPVDRHLVNTGEAPSNWMRLRVPLSLGLGTLTIAAGALMPNGG